MNTSNLRRFLSLVYVQMKLAPSEFSEMRNKKNKSGKSRKKGLFGRRGRPDEQNLDSPTAATTGSGVSGSKFKGIVPIAMLMVFMCIIFIPMGMQLMGGLKDAGMESQFATIVTGAAVMYQVFTLLLVIPATMFLSQDTEVYLSMPLKPREIIGAKMIALMVQTYATLAMIILPMIVGGLIKDFSIHALISWIIVFLTSPLLPTAYVTILMLLILQIAPVFRSRQSLSVFTGILGIAFAIVVSCSVSFMSGSIAGGNASGAATTASPVLEKLRYVFPSILGAEKMLYGNGTGEFLLGLLILLGTGLLAFLVALLFAEKLYFPIVLSIGAEGGSAKKLSAEETTSQVKRSNRILPALMKREWAMMFRTPAVFLNSVLSSILFPVLMIGLIAFSFIMNFDELRASGVSIAMIRSMLMEFLGDQPSMALAIGLVAGMVIAMMSTSGGLTSTAISRDARHLDFLKSVPVPAKSVFLAKFLTAYLISLITLVIPFVAVLALLPKMPLLWLSLLAGGLVGAAGMLIPELYLDIKWPKLDWMDEAHSVKNKNQVISSLLGFCGFLILLPLILFLNMKFLGAVLALLGLMAALAIVFGVLILKNSEKLLANIGEE